MSRNTGRMSSTVASKDNELPLGEVRAQDSGARDPVKCLRDLDAYFPTRQQQKRRPRTGVQAASRPQPAQEISL